MSKNLINIGFKFRNYGATVAAKEGLSEYENAIQMFAQTRKWLKWNKLDFTAENMSQMWWKRVLERPQPSNYRRILKRERLRKRDREVVKAFCNYIIYKEGKHKPL